MSNKSDITDFQSRKQQSLKSKINMRTRATESNTVPSNITTVAQSQILSDQRELMVQNGGLSHIKTQWEDHNAIHNSIAEGIVESLMMVKDIAQQVDHAKVGDIKFIQIVNMITKDCQELSKNLAEIKASYQGKTGEVSEEDYPLYYGIGNAYHNVFDVFKAVAMQVATEMTAYQALIDQKNNINLETQVEEIIKTDTASSPLPH